MSDANEIRQRLPPRSLCEALGIAKGARPQRGGLFVRCPAHAERTPSCSVRLGEDGTTAVYCFACGFSGDALDLVAVVRGIDKISEFPRLLEEAAAIAGTQVEPQRRRAPERRSVLDAATYAALAARLVELSPWPAHDDVASYVDRRVLVIEGSKAGLAGLPPPESQAPLLVQLGKTFEPETLALAGLVGRDGAGKPDLSVFSHPLNRLIFSWRGLDGSIEALQRRRLDNGKPKYVFPRGMRPRLPFGAERLRAHVADRVLVFVEGAIDVLALRLLDRRDDLGILPLGLPGLDGWRRSWSDFARGRHVRIGFDADAAAERKVSAVVADLAAAGAMKIERWTPRAKDWAALVEQGAPLPSSEERAS